MRVTALDALSTTALAVVEERGVLAVTGRDRTSWLNGVVTCDVAKVTPERAAFGLLLNKQGKIQTDFLCLASEERLVLATAAATLEPTQRALDHLLVMEDAELSDQSERLVVLSLHGPRALELGRAVGAAAAFDRTGLGGAVLLVERASLDGLLARLAEAGAVIEEPGDWPAVRVTRGIGEFGTDYGTSDNPHEAGLDRLAVAWDKGCYLGQETVFMQDARGRLKRRLVRLVSEAASPPPAGTPVFSEAGQKMGEVTSSAAGPPEEPSIALARIAAPAFTPGTRLVVAEAPCRVEPAAPARG